MLKQNSYRCSLILTPATIEEQKQYEGDLYVLYVLYKNPRTQKIKLRIPGLKDDMQDYEEAKEKTSFLNVSYNELDITNLVDDRPIYIIDTKDDGTLERYSLVNGIDIPIEDVLNGTFNFGKRKNFKKSDK